MDKVYNLNEKQSSSLIMEYNEKVPSINISKFDLIDEIEQYMVSQSRRNNKSITYLIPFVDGQVKEFSVADGRVLWGEDD